MADAGTGYWFGTLDKISLLGYADDPYGRTN